MNKVIKILFQALTLPLSETVCQVMRTGNISTKLEIAYISSIISDIPISLSALSLSSVSGTSTDKKLEEAQQKYDAERAKNGMQKSVALKNHNLL
jgi:hypothetical protein